MSKQAYQKTLGIWKPITLLPECKKKTEFGHTTEYQKVKYLLFGFIPLYYWVEKEYIVMYDKPTVEYYKCSCGEKD